MRNKTQHSAEDVFLHVQRLVEKGKLTPGHKLPSERSLAEVLGVRRSSVRDVMRTLRTFGLVRSRQGSGTYLCDDLRAYASLSQMRLQMKTFKLFGLMESRRIIEGEIAALAALRADPEQLEHVTQTLEDMRTATDLAEQLRHDFAFHAAVAEASHNTFLLEMLNITRDLLLESNFRLLRSPEQAAIAYAAHAHVLEAIRQRDPDLARKKMVEHLEQVECVFRELQALEILES